MTYFLIFCIGYENCDRINHNEATMMNSRTSAHIRSLVLARRRSHLQKLVLFAIQTLMPERVRLARASLGEALAKRRISVISYSDTEYNEYRRIMWGDYWFKHELIKAMGQLGYLIVDIQYEPDVIVHCFGAPVKLPQQTYNILWIHSNPDKITSELLAQYDRIYCISNLFAMQLQEKGFECVVVQQGTSKRLISGLEPRYDVVFVGNARGELGGTRQIVKDLGEPDYDFRVWGTGYTALPKRYWAGEYIDNCELSVIYGVSRISLNDHRPAMSAAGFINPRVFDILAAGGFCISDPNPAITELFGDTVPQYQTPEHLRYLVRYYLEHEQERQALARRGRAIASQYTWDKVARSLLEGISPVYAK